ncbi:hypothetical protein PO124_09185 [Bacillus licheniformis]|nr:hypothetical protein [Bacillus licheniformis]
MGFRPVDLYRTIDDPAVLLLPASVSPSAAASHSVRCLALCILYRCGRRCILSFALAYRLGGYFQHMPLKLDSLRTLLRKTAFLHLLLRLAPIHLTRSAMRQAFPK